MHCIVEPVFCLMQVIWVKEQCASINVLQSTLQERSPMALNEKKKKKQIANSVLQRLKTLDASNKHQLCLQ